jgi:WD40 repeat protein
VNSAAFSPHWKRVVTAFTTTARIWDAATGKPIGEPLWGHHNTVLSAAFSPDGKRIVTASSDKTARVWNVFPDTQSLVSAAKARYPALPQARAAQALFLPPELRIPRQSGQGFRFDVGHHSDLIPATIPK